ncbi:hypothetical protein SANTM175S_06879 [Streptomyces antimycoticus]
MVSGEAKTLERKPTGQTRIWTACTISGRPAAMPRKIPSHSIANRSHSSSPTASSPSPTPPCQRQPIARPTPSRTNRPSADWSMSSTLRPARTAERAIGIERKRSMTPLLRSWVMASIVPSRPNTMVSASVPGTRKSL